MTAKEARAQTNTALATVAVPQKVLERIAACAASGKERLYIIASEIPEAPTHNLWATELHMQNEYMRKLGKVLTNSPYGYTVFQDKSALTITW